MIQKDYDYYCELSNCGDFPISEYLYISRRLVYIADIQDEKSFKEWFEFPYIGKFSDFMENRFSIKTCFDDKHSNIEIQMPNDKNRVLMWLQPYKEKIKRVIEKEQKDYLSFLKTKFLENAFAVVDIGYNGNTQRKLGHILNKTLTGFYFYSDLSPENECSKKGKMIPCFQNIADLTAEKTFLFKYPLLLESMFTAPYGMIVKVDECGNRVCAKEGNNQVYFKQRLDINEGIQAFIKNIIKTFKECGISNSLGEEIFSDRMFGVVFQNSTLESKIADKFYWDDIIVQKRENGIFF